jgi:polysaccharide biosynthesis protein PslG
MLLTSAFLLPALAMALIALPPAARAFNYCGRAQAVFSEPMPYVGDSDWAVAAQPDPMRNCSLGLMAANHMGYYRAQLNWGLLERVQGAYDWSPYDQLVTDVASRHMRLLFVLIGDPSFESTRPPGAPLSAPYPPRDPQAFAQFAALAAQRYGPGGAFWRSNPQVPYYPVRAWEVWQEMNLAQSWATPNLRAYVRLLRPTYKAIHRVDRHATVIVGGMSFFCAPVSCSYRKSDEYRAISKLYRYGAHGYFDALGIHPYAATVALAEQRLTAARRLLNSHGDRGKAIWATEMGFAGGDPNTFVTNARKQRLSVIKFFRFVGNERGRLRLGPVTWFGWKDAVYASGPTNWWGFHLGLISTSGQPKPALAAMSSAAWRLSR